MSSCTKGLALRVDQSDRSDPAWEDLRPLLFRVGDAVPAFSEGRRGLLTGLVPQVQGSCKGEANCRAGKWLSRRFGVRERKRAEDSHLMILRVEDNHFKPEE